MLAFRWRTSALAQPKQWKRDTAQFAANETVGDVRRRLALTCGSSADVAADADPELWLCDEEGAPVRREAVRASVLLAWTPATCARDLFVAHANGEPRAVLVFTFPPHVAGTTRAAQLASLASRVG